MCVFFLFCFFQFDVTEYSDYLRDLNDELDITLETLKNTVQSKAAVPTSQVYVSRLSHFLMFIHGYMR